MTLAEYQALAQRTSHAGKRSDKLENACLGLAGECGEVCDIVKKALFQGHALDRAGLIEQAIVDGWFLLTDKPVIYVANIAEDALDACQGVHSRCWECECGDVCGVGEKYMRLLREEMRKRGTEWTGYDTAAAIIAQEELQRATARARSIEAKRRQRSAGARSKG